jgi:hypothetical protein
MSHSGAVVDKDLGFSAVVAEIEKAKNSYVIVGFPAGTQTHSQTKGNRTKKGGMSMVDIATANEFGTKHIPARSFMRTSFDENRDQIYRIIDKEYDKILAGQRTVKFSLTALGVYMEGLIRKKIRAIHFPPNAPRTIAMKKRSKPLIDFGQMIAAVTHKVFIQ